MRNGDIITDVIFGENTYSSKDYFNLDYELNDLFLGVSVKGSQVQFKVFRAGQTKTITITLSSENFSEIA